MSESVKHPIAPIYDENSKIVVLGSFPSVKSREQQFFYGHPQNRFWKLIATLCHVDVPQTIEEKKTAFSMEKMLMEWSTAINL